MWDISYSPVLYAKYTYCLYLSYDYKLTHSV